MYVYIRSSVQKWVYVTVKWDVRPSDQSLFSNGLYLKNFSIRSTWVRIILLQQYLFSPSLVRAVPSSNSSSCNMFR